MVAVNPLSVIIGSDLRLDTSLLSPSLAKEVQSALTMPNPAYLQAEKYARSTRLISPSLEFFQASNEILVIPRGFGPELARILGPGVTWFDRRRAHPEIKLVFNGVLRDYQSEAVSSVLSHNQGVLEASTGAGKTVMALAIIAVRRQPALILVHTVELMRQWMARIRQFLAVEPGQVGGGKCEVKYLTVGVVNSVRTRLEELVPRFGHIIVDECHRCPSSMFTEAVSAFDARFLLGLSATPYRRDGLTKVIHFYLGPLLHRVNPARLRSIGAVLRPTIVTRETDFVFRGDASEQYQSMLTALVEDPVRNEQIAEDVSNEVYSGAGAALVVSDRVAQLKALDAALARRGIEMALLHGSTSKKQRESVVERLARGDVRVLGSTVQLIGEGFDAPGLSSIFLATPIKFVGRVLQVVGRVLRPQEGKTPKIYDYLDSRVGVLEASARARKKVFEGITS